MTRVTDMTAGKPMGLIFFFSLPLMFGGMFQQLYMIVDTIIVGRGVGISALASLGAADWINWLVLWGIQGFTHGFSILVAQEFGAGNTRALRRTVAMIVKLCLLFGVIVTAASLLAADPLLRLLGTESSILGGARVYLYVQFAGSLVIIAYNMAAAILRCLGDSRTPLIAVVLATLVNIGLDVLFVLVFHWGIFGAAIATVIAQVFSFLACLMALRRLPILRLTREDWKNDREILAHLCRMGIPTALQNSCISLGGLVLQSVLNGFGVLFVAGFTATNKLYGVLESTAIAFGYAMTAYMGQNRGARQVGRIDAGIRSVLKLSVVFSVSISLLMFFFGRYILMLFVSASESDAEQVLAIAHRYLMIMSAFLIILFLVHAYRSSLQGLGNTTVPMLSGFVEMFMRAGAALILPVFFGSSGIFFAEVAAWSGAAALMIVYYYARIGAIKREIENAGRL